MQRALDGGQASAMRQQTFDRITMSDNSRAQLGDQYHHNYHGPVYQSAAVAAGPPAGGLVDMRVVDALRFDGMDMRRATIKLAHGNTCQWVFDSPEYKEWRDDSLLEQHHGFLWMRGKPGAGKSTIMKLAVRHADEHFPNGVKISFFFNAKGTLLEKSMEGMYRSLLHQLLTQCAWLEEGLDKRAFKQPTWPLELLEECFRDCVLRLGPEKLICHIDALDECEESDVRNMVAFFEDLGNLAVSAGVSMHICFASRHYPHISIAKCVHMVLDKLKGHQEDIRIYVVNNLKSLEPGIRSELAEKIRRRARDVFLWVVVVVGLLKRECDRGRTHNLRAQLDAIPDGLNHLFEDAMLQRGSRDNQHLLTILLWILFARQPLTPFQLYHGVLYAHSSTMSTSVVEDEPSHDQINRFILDTSKGLLEITTLDRTNGVRVQFIHETVREYLFNGGIARLESSSCQDPTGIYHDMLKKICINYILHAERFLPKFVSSDQRRTRCALFPLLTYALSEVVAHAELAQVHGVSQNFFVEVFPLHIVLSIWDAVSYVGNEWKACARTATKTYIFALYGAPNLLRLELERITARSESRSNPYPVTDRSDPAHASDRGVWGHPLHAAISIHNYDCVKLLLDHGFDVNARGIYSTALETAIWYNRLNDMSIIKLLLQHGANAKARRENGDDHKDRTTVLHVAIDVESVKAARVLVEHGADIHARTADGLTALQYARKGRIGRNLIVEYLIEQERLDAASGAAPP
jgi:hypothetical protein